MSDGQFCEMLADQVTWSLSSQLTVGDAKDTSPREFTTHALQLTGATAEAGTATISDDATAPAATPADSQRRARRTDLLRAARRVSLFTEIPFTHKIEHS
ncbi:hypothetical protein [Streptomyces sp. NPDC049040]|uniref:hypothetical protein n=1 Tax=Streptomyces sp. NPDC049040 TaxID=3365593 RepID=UPI003715F725